MSYFKSFVKFEAMTTSSFFYLSLILIISLASISQDSVSFQNKAKFVFPEKQLAGETFEIEIELNDAAFDSYRRLSLTLPKGFSSRIVEKADAIAQGDQQNIKLLWTGPVTNNTQKIKIAFTTERSVDGNFRIPVTYEFLYQRQKKTFTIGNIDLQISATKRTEAVTKKALIFNLPDVAQTMSGKAQQNFYYSIQILQSSEYVSEAQLRKYFNLEQEKITEMLQNGNYYYLTGEFSDEKTAKNYLTKHTTLSTQGMVVKVVDGRIINH